MARAAAQESVAGNQERDHEVDGHTDPALPAKIADGEQRALIGRTQHDADHYGHRHAGAQRDAARKQAYRLGPA